MLIVVDSNPAEKELETLSAGIQNYNKTFLPNEVVFEKDSRFAVFAYDKNNQVAGGIRAVAFWNYCIIELLWLSEEFRNKGLGKALLLKAEEYVRDLGFEYIRVETTDFQAKSFYEKQGYEVFGKLTNYPKGHDMYCLVKKL